MGLIPSLVKSLVKFLWIHVLKMMLKSPFLLCYYCWVAMMVIRITLYLELAIELGSGESREVDIQVLRAMIKISRYFGDISLKHCVSVDLNIIYRKEISTSQSFDNLSRISLIFLNLLAICRFFANILTGQCGSTFSIFLLLKGIEHQPKHSPIH